MSTTTPDKDAVPPGRTAPFGTAQTGEVSANVAIDLVDFVRSGTIRNEQQFLLAAASVATAYAAEPDHYNSFVTIGTPGSGKTHLHDQLYKLLVHMDLYETTSGSGKSMIYDEQWDRSDFAFLDELQKPPEDLIEFLKSVHGGDEKFTYKITQGSTRDGFETNTIERYAMPYCFLYAQWGADMEMWDRLLKIPIHESQSKNKAVGAMAFDHDHIAIDDSGVEYGYQFDAGTQTIQHHVASMKGGGPWHVVLPNGGSRGDGAGQFAFDVWDIIKPIFKHGRSEVNRIYSMVANIIRGWAIWNYKSRETVPGDQWDGVDDDVTVIVADAQDVANVLSCRQVLLGTTHSIDRKKRAVAEAIREKSGRMNEVDGLDPIQQFLKSADAPTVPKSELENILASLEDNFLVSIDEDAGERGHIYGFSGWDELGFANVPSHADVFEGTVDPVKAAPFLDSMEERRAELDTDAQDLLGKASVDASERALATGNGVDNAGGLSAFGGGVQDERTPVQTGPVEDTVLDRLAGTVDGVRVENLDSVPVEALLGMIPLDDQNRPVHTDDTLLDPAHDCWDQPDRGNGWVATPTQARRELKTAIDSCIDKGLLGFSVVHDTDETGAPIDATLHVER